MKNRPSPLSLILILAVVGVFAQACSRTEPGFYRIQGGQDVALPLQLDAYRGVRDGAEVHVEALFKGAAGSAEMNLVLKLNPAAECTSGRYQANIEGMTTAGTVECTSLNFLGGQNSQPSLGGLFILNDAENRQAFRIVIPTTVLERRAK